MYERGLNYHSDALVIFWLIFKLAWSQNNREFRRDFIYKFVYFVQMIHRYSPIFSSETYEKNEFTIFIFINLNFNQTRRDLQSNKSNDE